MSGHPGAWLCGAGAGAGASIRPGWVEWGCLFFLFFCLRYLCRPAVDGDCVALYGAGGPPVRLLAACAYLQGDSLAAAVFCHGLASVANSLHALGFIVGQLEVGGANAGILAGISNQIANVAGAVLPMIAAALRLHTGGASAAQPTSSLCFALNIIWRGAPFGRTRSRVERGGVASVSDGR